MWAVPVRLLERPGETLVEHDSIVLISLGKPARWKRAPLSQQAGNGELAGLRPRGRTAAGWLCRATNPEAFVVVAMRVS